MGVLVTVKDLPPPLKYAHPLCVWKKVLLEGLSREEAAKQCLLEGKVQGIPKLFGTIVRVDGYALASEVERLRRLGVVPREEAIKRLKELYEKALSPTAKERIGDELWYLEAFPETTITVEKLRELEELARQPPRRRTTKEYSPLPWIRLRRVFKVDNEWEGEYEIHADGKIDVRWREVGLLGLSVSDLRTYPKERIISFMVEYGIPRDQAERVYSLLLKDVSEVFPGEVPL